VFQYPEYESLTLRREGHVLYMNLNRPDILNATNAQTELDLVHFFSEVNRDNDVRAIVFSGEGKAFSAGGDFDYMRELIEYPEKARDAIQVGKRVVFSMLDCVKPIIARLHGHAIGLGATLALFSDVCFAADHVRIADPHVTVGFVAGDGGAIIWPQLIGYNRAKEFLMSGEALPASEAARIGLINHAVPADQLDDAITEYVNKVINNPPRAVQWTKVAVNIGLKQVANSIMDASLVYEILSGRTDDHREALQALAEKRKPVFTGN
jgi:enoyl-CoA hydratase/carnithine racemase